MIEELLAHHILDHSFNISLWGVNLPITQHSIYMFGISVLLFVLLIVFAKKKGGRVKTFLEMFVTFVRDEIAVPNLGEKEGRKLTPFFCSLLIFLLAANYVGMLPGARTITSNISVTGGMAILSLILILGLSIKENGPIGCLKTFVPGGVPGWLVPLLFPLEILSLIIKVFVLAVRLFANMTAGHIVLIGLFSFIFIMGERSIAYGYGTAGPVLGMTLFVSILELLVAAIQAYVFTLLTAIFAGLQMHSH